MKHKFMFQSLLAVALVAGGTMTAFAAETDDTNSYGYLTGQSQNSSRHTQFESLAGFTTDAERNAFFEAQGIGGGQYSDSQHLDVEALIQAGIIDQATADNMKVYGSDKHDSIHNRYSGDTSSMTPEERHTLYAGYEKDGFDGDSVDELLSKGIITQEQADAIQEYLG